MSDRLWLAWRLTAQRLPCYEVGTVRSQPICVDAFSFYLTAANEPALDCSPPIA